MFMSDLTGSSGQVLKPVSEVIVLESPYVTITQVSLVLHGGYSDVKIPAQLHRISLIRQKILGLSYHDFHL